MTSPLHDLMPEHGGQLRDIVSRYGISTKGLIDFSASINPLGPPKSAIAAIRLALEEPSTLATYPDLELLELKEAIAKNTGLQPENIAVANGFVPLLEAALRSLKIKHCLLPVPSFGEYRHVLETAGVAVAPYRLSQDKGFKYEIDAILAALLNHPSDAILLANPQNPSGALCEAARMRRLIDGAAQHGITVLLDEAFIDYSPSDSLTQLALKQANVIAFRSVTKFFGIPGLRVAYAAGESSIIHSLNRFIAPWPITSFSGIAVCAALPDFKYAEESLVANDLQRFWLEQELERLKIVTYPSRANFLLLRFPAAIDTNLLWKRMIVEEQLVLRSCANFEGLAECHLRIAVRSQPENQRLIRGLERILPGIAG
jgi:threonine-phosphate decarboxylase